MTPASDRAALDTMPGELVPAVLDVLRRCVRHGHSPGALIAYALDLREPVARMLPSVPGETRTSVQFAAGCSAPTRVGVVLPEDLPGVLSMLPASDRRSVLDAPPKGRARCLVLTGGRGVVFWVDVHSADAVQAANAPIDVDTRHRQ